MYKLNGVKYETEAEVAEAIDKYLTMFIEAQKSYEIAYQDILDNAELDPFSVEALDFGITKKMMDSYKALAAKKIVKAELKQQKVIDSNDIKVLIKDVEKSIKFFPKVKSAQTKTLAKFKNTDSAIDIEMVKIMLDITQRTIKQFEEQKELNNSFREVEQER